MSGFFNAFPQSDVTIVSGDGKERSRTKALIDKKHITFPDVKLTVEPGDEIRRQLPNGSEEAFRVLDVHYSEEFHGLPASLKADVERKGSFTRGQGGNYSIHVTGQNSRLNIQSIDNSRNTIGNSETFSSMKKIIGSSDLNSDEKEKLIARVSNMQKAGDSDGFKKSYQDFISSAANHMTILAPFLPALSQML